MKTPTKRLSGPAKDRFFKRFFSEEDDLQPQIAERLADKSAATFTSVQVRKELASPQTGKSRPVATKPKPKKVPAGKKLDVGDVSGDRTPEPMGETGSPPQKHDTPQPSETPLVAPPPSPAQVSEAPQPETTFDPFAIGLVPTYQRAGPEGLMAKLSEIQSPDDLRLMAKSQRIVIARELRTGDGVAADIRTAIVAAVKKKIEEKASAAG